MKILVVCSSLIEIDYLIHENQIKQISDNFWEFTDTKNPCFVAVCGIGLINTVINLNNILINNKYDIILNIGICGSSDIYYSKNTNYIVSEDKIIDSCIIKPNKVIHIDSKSNFVDKPETFYSDDKINAYFPHLNTAKAISVSSFYNNANIERPEIYKKFGNFIESMEGQQYS